MKPLTKWEKFERISKILQLVILIIGAGALFQIPYQIKQMRHEIGKSTFDVLWKLETRLREGNNDKIMLAIWHKKPVITQKITEDDLDLYLSDVTTISDVYDRRLITMDDVYEWFYYYVVDSYENPEVKKYIAKSRKEDPESYDGLDRLYKELKQFKRPKK